MSIRLVGAALSLCQGLLPFQHNRAGACFSARQGMRGEIWLFQMSIEKRRIALKQARPFGLRVKSRHALLWALAREQPLPASHAWPGEILRSNAACAETPTDPKVARIFTKGFANVWELVKSGGWMMLPIILSSIAAAGIVAERLWTLRSSRVMPAHLLGQVWLLIKEKKLNAQKLKELRASSPLGEVLAAGLANSKHGRDIMKECIQEAAARVIHDMERYMNALGTIAAMAPMLGLLGTVLGMIQIFSAFIGANAANASVLAGGIATALVTTAAGLIVAIPALFFHRFLQRRIEELVVGMEQEAIKLVEVVQGDRDVDLSNPPAPAAAKPPVKSEPRKEGRKA